MKFMRAANRTAVANRRQKVAELYLRGITQHVIGEQFGVTQATVSYDLKYLRLEWQQSALMNFSARKAQELAKIDEVERAAWDGWRRSLENAETTRAETDGEKQKAVKIVEGQGGNPQFLSVVLNCVERRCKILGVDAPAKVEGNVTLGIEVIETIVTTRAEAQEIIAALRSTGQLPG